MSDESEPTPREIPGRSISLRFDARRCLHGGACMRALPAVFGSEEPGAELHPDAADADEVARVVTGCPSGALGYTRHDGGPEEAPPPANVVRTLAGGPLAFHGDLRIGDRPPEIRAALCRCGASRNKPYCDRSHERIGFAATGEPEGGDAPELSSPGGPLTIRLATRGPLKIRGPLEIQSESGRTLRRLEQCLLCRCGASETAPLCDGSHYRLPFETE